MTLNRRQIVAALPFAGAALAACTQTTDTPATSETAAAPPPAAPASPPGPPPIPLAEPALPMTVLASGLQFPEAPLPMNDGSLLFVEIQRKTLSRLTPDGKVEIVRELEGAPNGLAIGPDGALYIANNGGRWSFNLRDGINYAGGPIPETHAGGWIERLDLKTGDLTRLYDSYNGKSLLAPDDLVFDSSGAMWITEFGTAEGNGAIYYATADGKTLKLARGNMTGVNGIGLSPDGKLLHVSLGRELLTFDVYGKGNIDAKTYYNGGHHGDLHEGSIADSLKVQADGRVAVCSLIRPGGVTILDRDGKEEFLGFPDRMVCNLAFGGPDMRDCWITMSGLGQIVKVRWPYPGLKPAFNA
jgi:gluconolactonase